MATLHLTNPNQFISSSSIYVGFQQKKLYRDFLQLDFALWSRRRNARSGRDSGPYFTCSFAPMESTKIKVVGVGGGGNNAVNRMIGSGLQNLPQSNDAEEEYLDEDAIEALFSQLEEDLKNDNLSVDGSDDEISEEDLNRLESELEEALRDDDGISDLFNPPSDTVETAPETDEEEEEEQPVKLKSWQLKRLAYALKIGRRKTSIKSLAAELCLDRALVLELLREPPPNLLMMSAALPEQIVPTVQEPESKTIESVPEETTVDVVEPEPKVRVPVHEMQSRWSAQKRLKKVQVETLERVYNRTKRPTNAMISSIVHVTNLPRKRVVKWFEDKRAEDGVPGHRIPYHRSAPDTVFIN